ncbi:MAG: ribonuclease H-like domain-containing protein [Gammaproteobacteria bacterium]|nr:ribonuclease H-like domain-containing protein [Gammaproteobacteria bacterium]
MLAPGLIRIEQRVPLDAQHGRIALKRLLAGLDDLPEAAGLDPRRLVFLDTETTGLAGGTGTVVFLLGLARLEADSLAVRQDLLTRFEGERAMLAAGAEWLERADALVTFNGRRFDVPLLSARCRLIAADDGFAPVRQLDLLYPLRRAYRTRWEDCRLISAETRLLGFEREDDVPGAMAPEAWRAYLQQGDARLLEGVTRHNRWDVVSLAALLPALAAVHADPAAFGADVLGVARAQCARDEDRARELLRAHGAALGHEGMRELASLHRRTGEWQAACALWRRLAAEGCERALESLAKYHEHVRREYAAALEYAARLADPAGRERRVRRLRQKLARSTGRES